MAPHSRYNGVACLRAACFLAERRGILEQQNVLQGEENQTGITMESKVKKERWSVTLFIRRMAAGCKVACMDVPAASVVSCDQTSLTRTWAPAIAVERNRVVDNMVIRSSGKMVKPTFNRECG